MTKRWTVLFVLAAAAAACRPEAPPPAAPPRFSLEQLNARFYADLGADAVDPSAYPEKARDGYAVFVRVCSQCHTPARALNGPEVGRAEWEQHIGRMHQKTLVHGWWTEFAKADAKKVLDFLEHDSKVRKVDGKAAFAAETERLKALLKDVEAERNRLQLEDGRARARPEPDYVGVK